MTLVSVKLSLKLELGAKSTRPSLLMLTVELLLSAVAITLSEKNVPPEIAFWPLTVTCPEIDSSPDGALAPGDANTTIE